MSSIIIGDKIRRIREMKGINPKEIAEELKMSLAGYHKIERGAVDINTEKLEKISDALGVKPSELLNFDEKYIFTAKNQSNFCINGQINQYHNTKLEVVQEKYIVVLEQKIQVLSEELAEYKSVKN